MGLLSFFSFIKNRSDFRDERIKHFYENADALVDIEFSNRTNKLRNIWVEPTCTSIDLDNETEYKITTHDKYFKIEFDDDNRVIFWLQYSFGFKLYKRPINHENPNTNDWILDFDLSHIN